MTGTFTLRSVALVAVLAAVSACNGIDNPLEGQRDALRAELNVKSEVIVANNRSEAISFAAPVSNADWTHRAGSAAHLIPHPILNASLTPVWNTSIGAGDTKRTRLTADPVVAGGRVFTLDSQSRVTAMSTATGDIVWTRDLTPATDNAADGSGGGLAYGAEHVFVTTGFGELAALNPATGAVAWKQDIEAPAGAAPTVYDGIVYLATRDSTAWAIDADTGRIRWQVSGTPSGSNVLGGPGVAVNDRVAIFPFPSGEVLATFRRGGVRLWNATVSGGRSGLAYARISDITGDPVIDGDRVYVANQSGRIAALDIEDGSRLWTASEGAYSPVVPAGGSVFAITDQNQLVRLNAQDGTRIWGVALPLFTNDKPKRRKGVFAHYGPVLAGGRLIVASSDGLIRSYSPQSGALLSSIEIAGGAGSNPVVAGATLYVVSKRGQLHAFR